MLFHSSGHYRVLLHSISFILEVSCPKMIRNENSNKWVNIVSNVCRFWPNLSTERHYSHWSLLKLIPEISFSRDKSEKQENSHFMLSRRNNWDIRDHICDSSFLLDCQPNVFLQVHRHAFKWFSCPCASVLVRIKLSSSHTDGRQLSVLTFLCVSVSETEQKRAGESFQPHFTAHANRHANLSFTSTCPIPTHTSREWRDPAHYLLI